jgi:Na+/melibiose symporter-like transporter
MRDRHHNGTPHSKKLSFWTKAAYGIGDLGLVSLFWLVVTLWDAIVALLPVVLRWSGYVQPTAADPTSLQPASALSAQRLVISVFPALLLMASVVVAWFYPITRRRYAEISRELAR